MAVSGSSVPFCIFALRMTVFDARPEAVTEAAPDAEPTALRTETPTPATDAAPFADPTARAENIAAKGSSLRIISRSRFLRLAIAGYIGGDGA
jgi:hypothetical protein